MSAPSLSWRKWILRAFVFGAVAAATLVALAYGIIDFSGRRAWDQTKRELLAKGEPLSLTEIIPAEIPDEQNFFAAPVWKDMTDLVPKNDPYGGSVWIASKDPEKRKLNAFRQALSKNGNSVLTQMGMGKSRRGAFLSAEPRNLDTAASFYRENQMAPSGLSSAETVLAALDAAQPELEAILQAASRPAARFPTHYEDGPAASMEHNTTLLSIGQYLALRTSAEMASGRGTAAMSDIFLLLRLADAPQNEPFLISQLVRVALVQISIGSVWEGLAFGCWTEAELEEIELRLAQMDLSKDLAHALRGERANFNQTMEMGKKDSRFLKMFLHPQTQEDQSSFSIGWRIAFAAYPEGWFFENLAFCNRFMQRAIDLAETGSYSAEKWKPLWSELEKNRNSHPVIYLLSTMALSSIVDVEQRFAEAETRLRQALIACALERYKLAHREIPESLTSLVPSFLPDIPNDPMTGNPFHYQRETEGNFMLWSVGPNGRDNHAVPHVRRRTDGDWVWRKVSL